MNTEEFLEFGGTGINSVINKIEQEIGLDKYDLLLAVGSLPEGLGSRKSDLDFLLIKHQEDTSLPKGQDDIGLICGKCLINVQIFQQHEIETLLAKFKHWSTKTWNVDQVSGFDAEDRTILHRLLNCNVFSGRHMDNSELKELLPKKPSLASLKLHYARRVSRTIQVDMIGYREERDYCSLMYASQHLLGHAVDALLAGYLLTNPNEKWRNRLLQQLTEDWAAPICIRPTKSPADQFIWNLHRAPAQANEVSCIKHALAISTFARAIFMWAESTLIQQSVSNTLFKGWAKPADKENDCILPSLDFDVDFSFTEQGLAVARLNEFAAPFELSLDDFLIMLLFDGVTSAREAETFNPNITQQQAQNHIALISSLVKSANLHYSRQG